MKTLTAEQDAIDQQWEDTMHDMIVYGIGQYSDSTAILDAKHRDLADAVGKAKEEVAQYDTEIANANFTIENLDTILGEVETSTDKTTEAFGRSKDSVTNFNTTIGGMGTYAKQGADGVRREVGKLSTVGTTEGDGIGTNIKTGMNDKFNIDGVTSKVGKLGTYGKTEGGSFATNFTNGINSNLDTSAVKKTLSNGFSDYGWGIGSDVGDNIIAGIRSSVSGVQLGVKQLEKGLASLTVGGYATGGFPTSGQLFFANEAGNPELVGRIGNQTAVANSGQIVDALAQGVYMAMARANGNNQGSSNTEVNVYMDSERLAQAVDRGNKALNRRFNVSLA